MEKEIIVKGDFGKVVWYPSPEMEEIMTETIGRKNDIIPHLRILLNGVQNDCSDDEVYNMFLGEWKKKFEGFVYIFTATIATPPTFFEMKRYYKKARRLLMEKGEGAAEKYAKTPTKHYLDNLDNLLSMEPHFP